MSDNRHPSPDDLRLRLREGIDRHRRRLRLALIGIVGSVAAVSFGVQHLASSGSSASAAELPKAQAPTSVDLPTASSSTKTSSATKTVVVQVVGAVNNPGVIEVDSDARVNDAVALAGGTTADADLNRVNLAAKVVDGAQISVPTIGQPSVAATAPTGTSSLPSPSGPVNINTASVDELDTLPGVGPALAAAIVSQREKLGSFKSIDELNDVKGIGDAKFADIKDLVTV